MIDISFIILTWNSAQTIDDCLESISGTCSGEDISYEVIIVDNGSRDDTVERIERHAANMPVSLTKLSGNRGTTRTRNMALRQACGGTICVLDSDAALREGSLRSVIDTLSGDQSIGILAPPHDRIEQEGAGIRQALPHYR